MEYGKNKIDYLMSDRSREYSSIAFQDYYKGIVYTDILQEVIHQNKMEHPKGKSVYT